MENILLSDFLEYFDFKLVKGVNNQGEIFLSLKDKQNVNIGDIETDEFIISETRPVQTIISIIERLDVYVQDYIISSIQDILQEKKLLKNCSYSLEELMSICNKNNVKYTIIADYIVNPNLIIIDKLNEIEERGF